jgi:glycerophosphoryl diester phosphodiesterase
VEALHRQGKRVFVWTVNEQETMERLIGLNVDAILTNDPQLALDTIKNHQGFADFYYRLSQILLYLQ